MRRGALSLAQVLEEEYEYVTGKPARCKESEAECWLIRPHEIIDARSFYYAIVSDTRKNSRFGGLKSESLTEAAATSEERLREVLVQRLNALLRDDELVHTFLNDDQLEKPIFAHPDRCGALLDIPQFRAALCERSWFLKGLLDDEDNRTAIAHELNGSEELIRILESREMRELIRKYPAILGALIDDVELRELLGGGTEALEHVVEENEPAPTLPSAKVALRRILQLFVPKKQTVPVVVTPSQLADIAASSAALKAIAEGKTVGEAIAQIVAPSEDTTGIRRGNAILLELAFGDWIGHNRAATAILRRMHDAKLAAICLSGGGIRSATFNLGVLQALANRGVLSQFKYISTVSGGGYIGAWLSSWMRRHDDGADGAINDLAARTGDPLDPEPEPLRHLRDYSRYLAPQAGIFTVDLWTIIAIYIRNLLLNWTLLLPPILAILLLPRFGERVLMARPPVSPEMWLVLCGALLVPAMALFAWARPKVQVVSGEPPTIPQLRRQRRRTMLKLLPVFLSALVIAVGIGWHLVAVRNPGRFPDWESAAHLTSLAWIIVGANLAGAIIYVLFYGDALRRYDDRKLNRLYRREAVKAALAAATWPRALAEVAGALAAACAAAVLFRAVTLISRKGFGLVGAEVFLCFAVPLVLLVFIIEGAILLGVTTLFSSEHEREWVARAASGVMLVGLGWIFVTGTSLLVPIALYQSPEIIGALGGISGLIALLTGRSAKTAANVTTRETTSGGRSLSMLIGVAAAISLIVIGGAVSMLATEILQKRPPKTSGTAPAAVAASPASKIAVNTVVTPDGASNYNVRISSDRKPAPWSLNAASRDHIETLRDTDNNLVWLFFGAAFLALVTGFLLDVNTYSMHSMYRNRLIRAYLGGSRWHRRPEPFTGFDPQDDLQMHQLRPELLWAGSFTDFTVFLKKLIELNQKHTPGACDDLFAQLPERVRELITAYMKTEPDPNKIAEVDLKPNVFGAINDLMHHRDFARKFAPAVPSPKLLKKNRKWLDEHYPGCIKQKHSNPPLHVINIALNLVAGDRLAWQQRKAESFTVSPLHAGSSRLGYRDTREYGGAGGISLGTAVAISGAAVSPNMGYHSSGAVTALMTLFNARLGWWYGNPGATGAYTFEKPGPPLALEPLLREATGLTNDSSSWVFLSDGGHFENLGLYEMVLRRCRHVIVCDATADDKYAFNDLGNAVRKIRIDLGVPIEFDAIHIEPSNPKEPGAAQVRRYCAIGRILYSRVDRPSAPHGRRQDPDDGWLLYIKPVVYEDCPVDIRNYSKTNPAFPHESTGDQFFSETQFESYRALGAHCISRILGEGSEGLDVESFFGAAEIYVRTGEARRKRRGRARAEQPGKVAQPATP